MEARSPERASDSAMIHLRQAAAFGVFLGLAAGQGATAQEVAPLTSEAPSAALVIAGSPRANLEWRGQGAGRAGIALCVSSTTGRFAINVASTTGQGLIGATPLEYSVRFENQGDVQSARIATNHSAARFEGHVAPERGCDRGPNARLVISLESDQAMAGSAGAYSDQVKLTVEPL